MWWLLLLVIFLILLTMYLIKLNKDYYILSLCKRIKTIDGSRLEDQIVIIPGVTRFGNNFDMLNMTPEKLFIFCRKNTIYAKQKSYLLHFLLASVYNITTAEDAEEVFQSPSTITKSVLYDLLKPFLGDGLLISTDQKWRFRRKILTPAFHFNVLESFNEVFKEESVKLMRKLRNLENLEIDVDDVIREFALNNICETALGVKLDNIPGSAEYRKIIHDIETTIVRRVNNPLLFFNLVFYLFGQYKKQKESLKVAHDFSSKIIEAKRKEYRTRQMESHKPTENEFGMKKRYALLDTLLEEETKGLIDHQVICDEVNTFMFEGYDTTSTCLMFTIFALSLYPEVQKKCRQEIEAIADFSSMTVFDFNKLDYLECVLKESARLFPPVPFIARKCVTETQVNGLILPENSEINIHIYDIMHDSRHFPEPDLFKPERFLLESSAGRNPFAFVPFSAGSRNCIGQKFALLEMKAILVAILMDFEILPITKLEDITLTNGLILRTKEKIFVKLSKIKKG